MSATLGNGSVTFGDSTVQTTALPSPGASGNVPVSNGTAWVSQSYSTGVTSAIAGTGISVSSATGAVTITNTAPATAAAQARAWVTFYGSTGAINNSYNVSSVSRTGTGNYTVNFTTTLNSVYFCPLISVSNSYNPVPIAFDAGPNLNSGGYTGYASANYFKFITGNAASSVPYDPNICSVAVFCS